jgi:hypothetical protein
LNPDDWHVGLPDYYLIGLGNDAYDVQNASSGYSTNMNATYSLTSTDDSSIRFELHSGDRWWWDGTGSERTEISSRDIISYGTPLDVSYKFTLEPGDANTAKWLVIGQLHQDYAPNENPWSPPFSINLVGEKMAINIGFTDASGNLVQKTLYVDGQNIVRGHEYDIDVKAVFDPSGNGHLVVTRDGVVIADYSGALGYSGHSGVYWKEGLYRSASPETIAATYADLQISHGDMVQIPATGAPATTPPAAPSLLVQTVSPNGGGTAKATISGTAPAGLTVNVYDGDHLIATTLANASGSYSLTLTGLGAGSHEISATYVQGGVFSRPSAGAVVEVGTASDILSRIDFVTGKDGLAAIILTDTHVFTISSTSQMNTLLTADKFALDKIVGGYSFQLFSGTTDNRTISYYDATGTLVETETKLYQSGVLVRDTLLHYGAVTVVKEVYQYGITGKSYTSTYQAFDAAGNMLEIKRFHADGTLDYHSIVDAQGTTTATSYNAAGVKTADLITQTDGTVTSITYNAAGLVMSTSITHPDKTKDAYFYNIAGASYVSEHDVYDSAGVLTSTVRTHTDGSLDYTYALAQDGTKTITQYDATGIIKTRSIVRTDGYSDVTNYTNGVITSEVIKYAAGAADVSDTKTYTLGVLTNETILHADKSKDVYLSNITGKTYVAEHDVYDVSGVLVSATRTHTDGSFDYSFTLALDGTKTTNQYDAGGSLKSHSVVYADGSSDVVNYSSGVVTSEVFTYASGGHDISDTKTYTLGVLTNEIVLHADHSKDVYLSNITGKSYVAEHDVYNGAGTQTSAIRTHADGTLDYSYTLAQDGTKTTDQYNAAGSLLTHSVMKADGSSDVSNYTNSVLVSEVIKFAAGSPDLSDSRTYTSGVLTKDIIVHADNSKDVYLLNVTGASYTSEHDTYNTAGVWTGIDRTLTDGTHQQIARVAGATLVSTTGVADSMTSSSNGGDTFVFKSGSGNDTVVNFHAGDGANHDTLQIAGQGTVTDFAAWAASHVHQVSGTTDAMIDLSSTDHVTLRGIAVASLTANDFHFV